MIDDALKGWILWHANTLERLNKLCFLLDGMINLLSFCFLKYENCYCRLTLATTILCLDRLGRYSLKLLLFPFLDSHCQRRNEEREKEEQGGRRRRKGNGGGEERWRHGMCWSHFSLTMLEFGQKYMIYAIKGVKGS